MAIILRTRCGCSKTMVLQHAAEMAALHDGLVVMLEPRWPTPFFAAAVGTEIAPIETRRFSFRGHYDGVDGSAILEEDRP